MIPAFPRGSQRFSVLPILFLAMISSISTITAFAPSRSSSSILRLSRRAMATAASSERIFPEELNIIYDSKCNVCKLEIDFLRNRDLRLHGDAPKLKFTDLEGETGPYDPTDLANGGVDYASGMASMHGIWGKDGSVRVGVPVFRKAYEVVQLGWLFRVTKVPGISWLADRGYDVFAKYRTNITRGASVDSLVEAYRAQRELQQAKEAAAKDCTDGSCSVAESTPQGAKA